MPRTAKTQTQATPAETTKAPKQTKATKQTKAPAKATKQTQAAPPATKRGKTLASKLNNALYLQLRNDLLGYNDQPGTLAQTLASGDYATPEQFEAVLAEWLDDRFGKTHKRAAYTVFSMSQRDKVVADLGDKSLSAVSKELGARWAALSESEQAVWKKEADQYNAAHAVRDFTPVARSRARAGSDTEAAATQPARATTSRKSKQVEVTDDASESSVSSDSDSE